MRSLILLLSLSLSPLAQATTQNVAFGHDADLAAGDVAIVKLNNTKSVVTCAPGHPLPSPFNFDDTVSTKYVDQLNAGPYFSVWCAPHKVAEVDTAIANALAGAKKKCESFGYPNCLAPDADAYVFTPFGAAVGDFGCKVVANIIGTTNP